MLGMLAILWEVDGRANESRYLGLTALAADSSVETAPGDKGEAPVSGGSRGILAMPVVWTRESLDDLVGRGIVNAPKGETIPWSRQVSRYEAAQAFDRAHLSLGSTPSSQGDETKMPVDVPADHWTYQAVRRCLNAGIFGGETGAFRGDKRLTRLEFARWLDNLIGSPPLPDLPEEVRRLPAGGAGEPPWGPQSAEDLRHPERFKLFRDIPGTRDRATVQRLVWWLILRPPQHDRETYRFLPDEPVNWNEFVVCLDRAASFAKPRSPDASTPQGAIAALKLAFWKADFPTLDRYLPAAEVEELGHSLRAEMRAIRFSFVDAQEVVDAKVTNVEFPSADLARVHLEYIPQWGDRETEVFEMSRRNGAWIVVPDNG
jgi:hypothetical protein